MKRILIISFLTLIILISFLNISYSATPITEESLETSFNEIKDTLKEELGNDNNDIKDITIDKINKKIKIYFKNDVYDIIYDLSKQPTFTLKVHIEKGISYNDFRDKVDNLNLNMLGYATIANIKGVKTEDSLMYFMYSQLANAFSSSLSNSNSYSIVDDTDSLNSTMSKNTNKDKIIYVSEFGDKVMEYVNDVYKDKETISDSNSINSYSITVEKQDTTDISCNLVSKLTVNTDADFSKIPEYLNKKLPVRNITKENADHAITLKLGQKCIINTNAKITSYNSYGTGDIEFSKDLKEITATSTGTKGIYLDIDNTKTSIFVTIEENQKNETLDPITLTIKSDDSGDSSDKLPLDLPLVPSDKNNSQLSVNNVVNNQGSVNKVINSITKLPQTGRALKITDILFMLFSISFIALMLIIIKSVKYKNIKK